MPIFISIVLGGIYTTGYVKGGNACRAAQINIEHKLEKKYDKIDKNTHSLSHDALFKRLRHFQRD